MIEVDNDIFKQKRRSFPLESIFIDAFPVLYYNLLSYVRGRLTSMKSDIKIAVVFKKYSRSKTIGTNLRVQKM